MIIFQNPGLIDLRAVTTMGLNAKEGDNPIGQFGTGLKYAIAVCLREGNKFSIWRGDEEYRFFTVTEHFRNKPFQFVMMNAPGNILPVQLGFTLDLGKDWEIWQALRELESNCRDEGGSSSYNKDWQSHPDLTTIVVSGSSFEQAYEKLGDIFITNSKPIWENLSLGIYQSQHPEQRKWLYYRGVRCQALEKPALYRYDIKAKMALTEDRTFKYSWQPVEKLTSGLTDCPVENVLLTVLDTDDGHFEHGLDWERREEYPETFCAAVDKIGVRCSKSAWRAVRKARKIREFDEVEMTDLQRLMLIRAKDFITRMGEPRVNEQVICVANDLGKNILGRYFNQYRTIYIAQRTFEMGMKQLISCLYEEYIHADRGYSDNDYEMQNFLFDTIISMAAKNLGEIL